jgi:hypothetical protein
MSDQTCRGADSDAPDERPEGDATAGWQRRWTGRTQGFDRIRTTRRFAHERDRKVRDRARI